ncbi:MAG TPA: lasso peptide biosynthesis B2 protein [Phenylobacterium sp.]|jgi:hypothetical protein|nr:lasso peptide biosynthesis B2 protein [Phenylobacterium sp.]
MQTQRLEPYRLAAGVHACGVNGDLVFLNVARDAYVCLPDGERLGRLSDDGRDVAIGDPSLGAELAAAGLIHPAHDAGAAPVGLGRRPAVRTPARSALKDRYDPPRVGDLTDMSRVLVDVLLGYRGRSLAEILGNCGPALPDPPRLTAGLFRTVDDFHRWAPFAPTSAKCLLRAYMLLRLLRRGGEDALWVFGVRTWPFHAHCWLQCEDVVLDDHPERIRAFTPIMVL